MTAPRRLFTENGRYGEEAVAISISFCKFLHPFVKQAAESGICLRDLQTVLVNDVVTQTAEGILLRAFAKKKEKNA